MATEEPMELLSRARSGDDAAASRLIALMYDDLRARARALFAGERAGHTLQPTALVNEAFVRLINADDVAVEDRLHFLHLASRTMRRVLVDHARSRDRLKRGGGNRRIGLTTIEPISPADEEPVDLLVLEEALTDLQKRSERVANVFELKYFGGLTVAQIAERAGVSPRTVNNDWKTASAFVRARL